MKNIVFSATFLFVFFGCTPQKVKHPVKLDKPWLDSIIKNSDSSYTKPYFRTDFVTAGYYLNSKDSSLCQVMKDSAGIVRQVIIVRKEVRTFYGQYYTNGQLHAWLPFDDSGQYNGAAEFYYDNGKIKSSGVYTHGVKTGKWKNFSSTGVLTAVEEFNPDGELLKTTQH
jgi:antitoxin component YwqK of YwqJK toxin-antitoxin module